MTTDETIHFDNVATHPSEVFAPAHLLDDAMPLWVKVAGTVGAALFIAAGVANFRDRTRGSVALFAACVVLLGASLVGSSRVGHHVGPLPPEQNDWGFSQATPGEANELFVSRDDALASARKASEGQNADPSRARAVSYRWGQWPERFTGAHDGTKDPDLFPKDVGWSDADLATLNRWASREYGISSQAVNGLGDGTYLDPTTDPSDGLVSARGHLTGPGTKAFGDDVDLYRCVIEIKNLRTNDLGQPLSVTPVRVVCTNSSTYGPVPTRDFTYPARLDASAGQR